MQYLSRSLQVIENSPVLKPPVPTFAHHNSASIVMYSLGLLDGPAYMFSKFVGGFKADKAELFSFLAVTTVKNNSGWARESEVIL
jgi:hypothetical protein